MNGDVQHYTDDGPELCAPAVWNGLASNPYHSWAFWRAEQVALAPSPFRAHNDIPIVMGLLRSLPPRCTGGDRMAAILSRLLDRAVQPLAALQRPRVQVTLGLPERMGNDHGELRFQRERSRLVSDIFLRLEPHAAEVLVEPVASGHASFAECVQRAARALQAREADVALVGGVDSAYDPDVVQSALDDGRVYDGENLDGYCPGEGGGLFWLLPRGVAQRVGLRVSARVHGVATANERAHSYTDLPCQGEGLTAAAGALTGPLRQARRPLDLWLHDVTSEVYRIHEMNLAWPRAAHEVMGPESTIHSLHPAFGDLGAAFGPTAAALAAEAFTRGDPSAERCLITASSPHERRGAILLGP